jgi:mono/diheme cytochrome c family protein
MGASPARVAILVAALALVGIAPAARATEAYARQTGKGCADCHASAQGGALSPAGEAFKANGYKLPKGGEPQQQTP